MSSISTYRENLFFENVLLVDKILSRMYYENINHDDLRQVGLLGLYKASRKYEEGHGTVFSTYATYYILGEIRREIRENKFIKIGRKASKVIGLLKKGFTINEIKETTGYNDKIIHYGLLYQEDVVSLNTPMYEDELLDYVKDNNSLLDRLKEILDDKLFFIIQKRYYEKLTQKEIGEILNISASQVSRLEQLALNILKNKV